MPTASFIISAYNAEMFLRQTLDSCLSQTAPPDKILVADDGSTDGTRQILEEYDHANPGIFELTLLDKNQGRSNALNKLIECLATDYALMIDADDIAFPTRLERQVAFMEDNPDVGISSSFVKHIDSNGKHIGNGTMSPLTRNECTEILNSGDAIGFYCPATIVRRSVFADKTLWLRQSFFPADDIDLWNRVAERGIMIVGQAEFLTGYRIHSASASTSAFKYTRLKYEFVRASMAKRRMGHSEPSWDEFLKTWNERPWTQKINAWRKDEAKARYRVAALNLAKKRHCRAMFAIMAAAALQPSYVANRIKKQFKGFNR
jgi:Glycosyltransferases, probably involved in cell wall biogenesis